MNINLPVNTTLREFEVRPEDLVEGTLYLIDTIIFDNNNCRFKGRFIRNEIDEFFRFPIISSFFMITESLTKTGCFNRNGQETRFLNYSTRYYTPPTQPLMDKSAQRQYRKHKLEKMINAQDINANDDNYLQENSLGYNLAQEYFSPRKKTNTGGRKTKRIRKKNTKKNKKKINKASRKILK